MINFIYPLAVGAIALATCNNEPSYTISGTVVEGLDAIKKVYLIESRSYQEQIKRDSAWVVDGKFSFTGRQDSTIYCTLDFYSEKRKYSSCDLFLENGDIKVIAGKMYEHSVTGTPNNDIYQAYKTVKYASMKKTQDLNNRFGFSQATEEEKASHEKRIKEQKDQMQEAFDRFIDSNMHNAVGLHLFLTNGFSIDRQKELLAKMPETYLSHPKVQQVIKNLELKEKTLVGKPFIDFEMPTPDGSTLKLSDVVSKHKYTLIDYWATWCAPCRKEMPHVIEAYNEYGQKGLAIIGISLDNHADKWKAAIKEWKMPWLHMSDLKGWKCEGAALYSVHAVPATVIIAQDGTIVARDLRGEALMAKLAELMK